MTVSDASSSASRHARIAALGYDYSREPKRPVDRCNLCGGERFTVITHRDRYGYPAQAVACQRCGLIVLSPVMTAQAYGRFYVDIYRPLVSAFHGRLIDARTIQAEQRDYARERGELLAPYLEGQPFTTLLDIGGSTGVVAHAWARRFGLQATVIDPSPLEMDEARRLGLETIAGFVEDWDPGGRQFDVVALCQTVDHLLDVSATLAAIRRVIRPDGLFFVDLVDFRAAYLRSWSVEDAIKIDHPYYFVSDTLEAYLARIGFDVLRRDFAADHLHISYVCRPASADPSRLPDPTAVAALLREVRYVQNAPRGRADGGAP